MNSEIAAFAEEHFDDKNADKEWNKLLKARRIETRCQEVLEELESNCNDQLREVSREITMRNNRQNIRSQFNAAANELEDYARQFIKDNVNRPLEDSIAVIDGNVQEIRDSRANRTSSCRELEKLQRDCTILIQDIHSEVI